MFGQKRDSRHETFQTQIEQWKFSLFLTPLKTLFRTTSKPIIDLTHTDLTTKIH